MTIKKRLRYYELLKQFHDNSDFVELMDLLLLRAHSKESFTAVEGDRVVEVDPYSLLIYELEETEKTLRKGR